jgi:hypothetical protein
MFDDLKRYLLATRLRLERKNREDIPIEPLMEEISKIAVENWMEFEDPTLSNKQLLKASTRVIARIYNRN